jgi:hypothetical protein
METDIEARLAEVASELARQDEEWRRVKRALARFGDEPLAVPREFLRQLDSLTPNRTHRDVGIRA